MKDSLAHLSQRKRGELARIVSIIRRTAPQAEMLILFGSYARGDAVEDIIVAGHTTCEYSSDFDTLVILPIRYTLSAIRYSRRYTLNAIRYFSARCVEILRDQTETSCEKKMESFI